MSIEVHTAEEALESLMVALCVMDGRELGPRDKAFRDIARDALTDTLKIAVYLSEIANGERSEPINPDFASRHFEV